MASGYGSKPDWSAFGGHDACSGHDEVVVWSRWRLVLDVVNPHLIGHVADAHNPVAPRPQMHVCTLPSSQSTPEAPRSHPPKGVGFPDPLSGDSKRDLWPDLSKVVRSGRMLQKGSAPMSLGWPSKWSPGRTRGVAVGAQLSDVRSTVLIFGNGVF